MREAYTAATILDAYVEPTYSTEAPDILRTLHVDIYGGPGPCCAYVRIGNPPIGALDVVRRWMLDGRLVDVLVSADENTAEIALHTPGEEPHADRD